MSTQIDDFDKRIDIISVFFFYLFIFLKMDVEKLKNYKNEKFSFLILFNLPDNFSMHLQTKIPFNFCKDP